MSIIRRQVLRDEVQEMILERLLDARWTPGDRLSIDGLAKLLGVSPTPVREALVALEQSGLVEYTARVGYLVAPMLTSEQVRHLLDARIVIETAALTRSFKNWSDFFKDLSAAHKQHIDAVESIYSGKELDYGLMREHFRADWNFHQTILKHAQNPYLIQMTDLLRSHTHRMREIWAGGPATLDAREALAEHAVILEKVRDKDEFGAGEALNTHLQNVCDRSLALLDDE